MSEVKEVAGITIALLKESGIFDTIKDFVTRKEQYTIIVLGASGTGKTSFTKRLRGLTSYIPREIRTAKSYVLRGKLDGKLKIKIIETPGQRVDPYTENRIRAINRAMAERHLGIINVVSYGYHEAGYVDPSVAVTTKNRPNLKFLRNRKIEELTLLSEWRDRLCYPGGPASWLVTVCAKADLWWTPDDASNVLKHYDEGKYFLNLGDSKKIDTSVFPFSAHNQQFYDLVKMSGYYTDDLRLKHTGALVARILENSARESI